MVKQKNEAKTSSNKLRFEYRFSSWIEAGQLLPISIETKVGPDSVGNPGYIISGSLSSEYCDEKEWPNPPHIAFANLRTEDPKSAEAFIRRYGVLRDICRHEKDVLHDTGFRTAFSVESGDLLITQDLLRDAWDGGLALVTEIEARIEEYIAVDVLMNQGVVCLRPKDLWTLICFLALRDYTAGKLGICENPDCPAPYFRKKRKTQKFCEAGPCVAYAQRQYSLAWWNREGNKRRKKKRKKKLAKRPH